jgi:hypothetical protein
VPESGQPGYEYFTHGSDATSVNRPPSPPPQAAAPQDQEQAANEPAAPAEEQAPAQNAAPRAESAESTGEQQPAADSSEPAAQDDTPWSVAPERDTESSVNAGRAQPPVTPRQRTAPPAPVQVQPVDPQGHYGSALSRLLDAYALLFFVGGASLLLLLVAAIALAVRAKHGPRDAAVSRRRVSLPAHRPARAP